MGEHRPTILLAEDHAELRSLLCGLLERAGYAVVAASDGMAALEAAAAWPIDLLVADVLMPRMGGVELARRLRTLWPGLRVLFVSSGRLSNEDVAVAIPGARFLAKPFSVDELTRAVSELLGARENQRASPGG